MVNNSLETIYFGGGCFWGIEFNIARLNGIVETYPGFMGGTVETPSYEEVSFGQTGHAEVVKVVYNKNEMEFRRLAKYFFEIHDPSQYHKQGFDIGPQYRSVVFYTNNEQKIVLEELVKVLNENGFKVVTELLEASVFYPAESYHHNYSRNNPGSYMCHSYKKRF